METKHTKGKWKYGVASSTHSNGVTSVKAFNIHSENENFSVGKSICRIATNKDDTQLEKYRYSVEECESNAQLIATAPELLEHLILLIDRMEENGLGHMSAVTRSIEIVERATGMKYERTPNFK